MAELLALAPLFPGDRSCPQFAVCCSLVSHAAHHIPQVLQSAISSFELPAYAAHHVPLFHSTA
jgi:hypothetical protein